MRALKITLVALVMAALAATAAAGDMTLTRSGDLYRIVTTDDGLAVSGTLADGTSLELVVPQTASTTTSAHNVVFDPTSGSLFLLWQQGEDDAAALMFAAYLDGTWTGPEMIAGGDGTAAANPELMLYRVVDVIEEEDENGEPILIEVATSFLHLTWWSYTATLNDGNAVYLPAPIDDDTSLPDFAAYEPVVLSSLLPYGIPHCDGIDDAAGLTAPKLFPDPQSGNPHLFASDFAECMFYIIELGNEVIADPVTERRRHTIILRQRGTYPVANELPLANSGVELGHDLSMVLYWDGEESVDYIQFNFGSVSDVMSLPIGDALSHEQAVDLIRGLVR